MYSDILSLTELIARLCRTQTTTTVPTSGESKDIGLAHEEEVDDDARDTQVENQLATTLTTLRTQLATFTEQLQYMLTPNLKAK